MLCLRATSPATDVRSLYKESRTGWPRSAQKILRAWLFLYTARTYFPHQMLSSHLSRKASSLLLVLTPGLPGRSLKSGSHVYKCNIGQPGPNSTGLRKNAGVTKVSSRPRASTGKRVGRHLLDLAVIKANNA